MSMKIPDRFRSSRAFRKGDEVNFVLAPGERCNLLARLPGVVVGRRGPYINVLCTEDRTIYGGSIVSAPRVNLLHRDDFIAWEKWDARNFQRWIKRARMKRERESVSK